MKNILILILTSIVFSSCMVLNIPNDLTKDIFKEIKNEKNNRSDISYYSSKNAIGSYSSSIKIGNYIYLSGQIGLRADTSILIGSDIESQTEQSLKNIETLLGNYNCSIENVISCTVYLKNINDFTAMNNVYEKFFVKGRYPTRTTVEVSNLPRNALIEITAVGYKY